MNDFATECIETCPGGKIMKRNLNEVFSNWSIDKYHNKKDAPTSKELHEWMTQRYGKYNGGWKNIQIKFKWMKRSSQICTHVFKKSNTVNNNNSWSSNF